MSLSTQLFPPALLAAFERLSIDARRTPASSATGAHLSTPAGASLDFRDFRPYTPGDDLRRVDWNIYQRTGGQLYLRRFEHPTTAPVQLLIDDSASMFFETQSPRYVAAARIGAAIAAAAARGGDPVALSFASATLGIAPQAGRRAFQTITQALSARADATTSAVGSIARTVDALHSGKRSAARGLTVVASDFLDPDGLDATLAALSKLPTRMLLLQIAQPTDGDAAAQLSAVSDDVELVDCESGAVRSITLTPDLRQRYDRAHAAHQQRLRTFANQRGATLVTIDASAAFLPQLERLFPDGTLRFGGRI